jgi:hypothetical protein
MGGVALIPGVALAQSGDEAADPARTAGSRPRPVGFELSAGTRFPLDIGIEGTVEAPFGLTAHLGLSWMPRFYRNMINETAVSFGWYDDTDAAIVGAALEDALLISPTVGWRPPPLDGFEVYGGYILTFLGGTITRAEAEEISDEDLQGAGAGIDEVPLSGTAHGFQLGVAYQVALQRHLALRLSLAYFQLFDSGTSIDLTVDGAAAQRVADRVEVALDDYLHDLLTTYVKAPLFGFSMVYRF